MRVGFCWDADAFVTAAFAHARQDLIYFCPHEGCLQRVWARRTSRSIVFYTQTGHLPGCPSDPRVPHRVSGHPAGLPWPRPEAFLPTHLGPSAQPKKTSSATPALLVQAIELARSKRGSPLHSGTLEEVVDAWSSMHPDSRSSHALTIGERHGTYRSTFVGLPVVGRAVASVPWEAHVVFDRASIGAEADAYLVQTVQRYRKDPHGELPIRLRSPLADPFPVNLPDLKHGDATLFWHGIDPAVTRGRDAYLIRATFDQPYRTALLRSGTYHPQCGHFV